MMSEGNVFQSEMVELRELSGRPNCIGDNLLKALPDLLRSFNHLK